MKKLLLLSILLFNTSLFSSNIPQSIDGLIEVFIDDEVFSGIYLYDADISYGYIQVDSPAVDTVEEAVLINDSTEYTWDAQTGVMDLTQNEFSYHYNFFNSPNPYIFPYTCTLYENNDNTGETSYGFFYDGRIDLDNNGVADETQLASGNPYSFDRDVFKKDLLINVLFASPGEFFSSLLPIDSGSENIEHYTVRTLKSEDLENWETVLTKTVKGTASNLFFKSEISPTE